MNKIAVVTGASGYIASELISQLSTKGYSVRGTVRDLNNLKKIEHLKLFPQLELFEADLLVENSFDEVCRGAHFIFHCASPFLRNYDDPQRELVDPALKGTSNVLSSCVKAKETVEAVVVTSSGAAIIPQFYDESDVDKVWDETDWNDNSTLEHGPYRLSKSLAEKEVWKCAEEHPEIRFSTICPTLVLGPTHSSRTDSVSIQIVKEIIDGTKREEGGVGRFKYGMVDVRNVAEAHWKAVEEKTTGRFIVSSEEGIDFIDIVNIIKEQFPDLPLPHQALGDTIQKLHYSNERARTTLGIDFIPIEKTVTDMVNSLIQKNLHDI